MKAKLVVLVLVAALASAGLTYVAMGRSATSPRPHPPTLRKRMVER